MVPGDRDRERAAAALREHYVRGRLTLDELSDRLALALAARSAVELRRAVAGLPLFPDAGELAAHARRVVRGAARAAVLAVAAGAYLLFSFVLLLALGLAALVHGVSTAALVVVLVVWLVPTLLLTRLWRRSRPLRRTGT